MKLLLLWVRTTRKKLATSPHPFRIAPYPLVIRLPPSIRSSSKQSSAARTQGKGAHIRDSKTKIIDASIWQKTPCAQWFSRALERSCSKTGLYPRSRIRQTSLSKSNTQPYAAGENPAAMLPQRSTASTRALNLRPSPVANALGNAIVSFMYIAVTSRRRLTSSWDMNSLATSTRLVQK